MVDRKLAILLGVVCVVEGWKVILLATNLFAVVWAPVPPNMPHLLEAAVRSNLTIEDPQDRECGIFGDVTGFGRGNLVEAPVTTDQRVGDVYRQGVIRRDAVQLGTNLFRLATTIGKLCLGYHPYIWSLTLRFTQDPIKRALCYFAFDNFLTRCSHVPVQFIRVSMMDPQSFAALQLDIIWNFILALIHSFFMYVWMQLIEKIGIVGWSLTPFVLWTAELVVSSAIILGVNNSPPTPLPPDVAVGVASLCSQLDYPVDRIRANLTDRFPLICYFSAVVNDVIIYSPTLLKRVTSDKMVAAVAHELAKRKYAYWTFFHFSLFVKSAALSVISVGSYDSLEIDEMFGFLPDTPHPTVSLYLSQAYILPTVVQIIDWVVNYFNRRYVYLCDHYVCSLGYSTSLKGALLALAGTSNRYPVLDSSWYSNFMGSVPKVEDRVMSIDLYEFMKSRQV